VQQQLPRGNAARVRVARRRRRAHRRQRAPAPGRGVQHVRVVEEGALRRDRVRVWHISEPRPTASVYSLKTLHISKRRGARGGPGGNIRQQRPRRRHAHGAPPPASPAAAVQRRRWPRSARHRRAHPAQARRRAGAARPRGRTWPSQPPNTSIRLAAIMAAECPCRGGGAAPPQARASQAPVRRHSARTSESTAAPPVPPYTTSASAPSQTALWPWRGCGAACGRARYKVRVCTLTLPIVALLHSSLGRGRNAGYCAWLWPERSAGVECQRGERSMAAGASRGRCARAGRPHRRHALLQQNCASPTAAVADLCRVRNVYWKASHRTRPGRVRHGRAGATCAHPGGRQLLPRGHVRVQAVQRVGALLAQAPERQHSVLPQPATGRRPPQARAAHALLAQRL
jgi:hypothetical protein